MKLSKIKFDAMVSLDYFFEGVEKLLEIWFGSSDGNNNGSLLKIPS